MEEAKPAVLCPTCRSAIPVDPDWRLAHCPRCGETITRMAEDSSYD